jgi:hypothetical protein
VELFHSKKIEYNCSVLISLKPNTHLLSQLVTDTVF